MKLRMVIVLPVGILRAIIGRNPVIPHTIIFGWGIICWRWIGITIRAITTIRAGFCQGIGVGGHRWGELRGTAIGTPRLGLGHHLLTPGMVIGMGIGTARVITAQGGITVVSLIGTIQRIVSIINDVTTTIGYIWRPIRIPI